MESTSPREALSGSPAPLFVGRATQLSALATAMDRARRRAVIRIVDAPPGLGKSALVAEFLRGAPAAHPGAVALVGRCPPGRNALYPGLGGVISALTRHLAALPADVRDAVLPRDTPILARVFPAIATLPGLSGRRPLPGAEVDVDPGEARRRVFAVVRDLLGRVAARWPLVVFVDDVQWSDPDGAALIADLLRSPGAPPLLLVLACRRAELTSAPMVTCLLEGARHERDPLDIGFIHVDPLTPAETGALAAGLAPAGLDLERLVADAAGSPGALHDAVTPPVPRRPVLDLDVSDTTGGAPGPEHAGDVAAEALAFDRACRQYEIALAGGADPWRVRVKRADALAAAGKGAAAARERRLAAEHAPPADAQRLRAEAARQLLLQGHVAEGMAALTDALSRVNVTLPATPVGALVSLLWHRLVLRVRGFGFRRRAAADVPPLLLACIDTCSAAAVALATFDQVRSAELHARGLRLALRAGEPIRLARALTLEFVFVAVGGSRREDEIERLIARAGDAVRESGNAAAAVDYVVSRGIAAFLQGRFAEARTLMEEGDIGYRTRVRSDAWERDNLNRFYARVLGWQGDLRRLVPLVHALVRDAEARGDSHISLHLRLRFLHVVRLCEDDVDGLVGELEDLVPGGASGAFHFHHFVLLGSAAEVDLYRGRAADAWNRVAQAWPDVERTLLLRVQTTRIEGAWLRGRCALAVLASLPADDARRARFAAIVTREARVLAAEGAPWAGALAAVLGAVAARIAGQGGAAVRLVEAAARLDACGMRLHAAAARLRAGEWFGKADLAARAWLLDEGVHDPERFVRMYVPGP